MKTIPALLAALLTGPATAWAAAFADEALALAGSFYGLASLVIFVVAYSLVPLENRLEMRKSKPVLIAAGLIWILVALAWAGTGQSHRAEDAILHGLTEYVGLFLFLLPAMTYINALEERDVFQWLRAFLVSRGYSLRRVFWTTGALAFLFSPIADNLTTALLLGAVVVAVGGNDRKFITLACIHVVVAANAGGAFSPFGDITTLMVWQKEKVAFQQFFMIVVPSGINWLVPALIMHFAVSDGMPDPDNEKVVMKHGAKVMMALFVATVATAAWFRFPGPSGVGGHDAGAGLPGCLFLLSEETGRPAISLRHPARRAFR